MQFQHILLLTALRAASTSLAAPRSICPDAGGNGNHFGLSGGCIEVLELDTKDKIGKVETITENAPAKKLPSNGAEHYFGLVENK